MNFHEFASLLDGESAHLALLSTYQFDPDFFERRLLHCPSLFKARRIVVFVDAGQWREMLRQEVPARLLNRRYLVVPVRVDRGVFHPKLNLLLTEQGGRVHCGSANLTRSGCSSNLELLNAIPFGDDCDDEESSFLAKEAFEFFRHACDHAEGEPGRICREWLKETTEQFPWLKAPLPAGSGRRMRLLHSYDGSLWDRLIAAIDAPPTRLLVISPFHDKDGEMVKRVCARWPKCHIEVLVQQRITTLPLPAIRAGGSRITLSELDNSTRRIHAKLFAWEANGKIGCLVGSANFTTAAFDARNVEACLLLTDAQNRVRALFDNEFRKRSLKIEAFEPGEDEEPDADDEPSVGLKLNSALLVNGVLTVSYKVRLDHKPLELTLAIRSPGERVHRVEKSLPNQASGTATVPVNEVVLSDVNGTLLASLIAQCGAERVESGPVWVIQQDRLTHESDGEGGSSPQRNVQETGAGLTEMLDKIGATEGVVGVAEYLRQLTIRFNDGTGSVPGIRKFRLQLRDPFHADVAPEWLRNRGKADDLVAAIMDFVDRHVKRRLVKHAQRGNINGLENFIDIFTAVVQLVYLYWARTVMKESVAALVIEECVQIATAGPKSDEYTCGGYLLAVRSNIRDVNLINREAEKVNFAGHIRAAIMIAQRIRTPGYIPEHGRPRECLPATSALVRRAFTHAGLAEPSKEKVLEALELYRMTEKDLSALRAELLG